MEKIILHFQLHLIFPDCWIRILSHDWGSVRTLYILPSKGIALYFTLIWNQIHRIFQLCLRYLLCLVVFMDIHGCEAFTAQKHKRAMQWSWKIVTEKLGMSTCQSESCRLRVTFLSELSLFPAVASSVSIGVAVSLLPSSTTNQMCVFIIHSWKETEREIFLLGIEVTL